MKGLSTRRSVFGLAALPFVGAAVASTASGNPKREPGLNGIPLTIQWVLDEQTKKIQELAVLVGKLQDQVREQEFQIALECELREPIEWRGDKPFVEHARWNIDYVLSLDQTPYTDIELVEAKAFLGGQQWEQEIVEKREMSMRPCLASDHISLLIASAEAGCTDYMSNNKYHSSRDRNQLIVILYRRNKDAQCVFNYEMSKRCELMDLRRVRFVKDLDTGGLKNA